ncbi:hypothetical protein Bca4012_063952 [Brassica carinata]
MRCRKPRFLLAKKLKYLKTFSEAAASQAPPGPINGKAKIVIIFPEEVWNPYAYFIPFYYLRVKVEQQMINHLK